MTLLGCNRKPQPWMDVGALLGVALCRGSPCEEAQSLPKSPCSIFQTHPLGGDGHCLDWGRNLEQKHGSTVVSPGNYLRPFRAVHAVWDH